MSHKTNSGWPFARRWLFGLCGLDFMALVKNLAAQDFMNIDLRINVWLSLWRSKPVVSGITFRKVWQNQLSKAELSETCISWDESSSMLHTHLSQWEEGYEIICLFSKKGKMHHQWLQKHNFTLCSIAVITWLSGETERLRRMKENVESPLKFHMWECDHLHILLVWQQGFINPRKTKCSRRATLGSICSVYKININNSSKPSQ